MPKPVQAVHRGRLAEQMARHYLEKQGLQFIAANYRCPHGEIDLIMAQQTVTIFVEVRYRRRLTHGTPLETIQSAKQARLLATAQYYLQHHAIAGQSSSARIDAVAMTGDLHAPTIRWVTNILG